MTTIEKIVRELADVFNRKVDGYLHRKCELWFRDLFYISLYILSRRDHVSTERARRIMNLLLNSQIMREGYRYMRGYGALESLGKWIMTVSKEEYIGGFPSFLRKDLPHVFGYNPDIDSSALSLTTLSYIIRYLLDSNLYTRFREHFCKGLKYLISRDLNGDGLLEQFENEDWMLSMLRCGSITYSNTTALIAYKAILDLARETDDAEIANLLADHLRKLSKAITQKLYFKGFFVEGVNCYGCLILRHSLDTALLGMLSSPYIDENKLINHLKIIGEALLISKVGLLANINPPQKTTMPKKIKAGEFFNGGIWPLYNFIYLCACLRMGVEPVIDIKLLYENARYMWLSHKLRGYGDIYLPSVAMGLYIYEHFSDRLR